MGLGRIDKLYLFTRACTKPTQNGQCIVGAPLMLERATSNSDTQDSPRPGLGGSQHLPPYSILYGCPQDHTSKWLFVSGLPSGSPEIVKVETPMTLGRHNFACRPLIEMRYKAKLQPSLRAFQRYVARHLHRQESGRFSTFSDWESNCQFDSRAFFWP